MASLKKSRRMVIVGMAGALFLIAGGIVMRMRTDNAASVLSSHTPSCVVYGVDDINNFDSQFFSSDIFSGSSVTKLTPVYNQYNLESMEYDPVGNLFYAGSGGIRNTGLYVLPADFSEIQRVYDPGTDQRISGLAYRTSNQTLYGWSKGGSVRGLVKYSKGGTKYNGVMVFDELTEIMSGSQMEGLAWYNDYLYAIDDNGDWYKGNRSGEPTGLVKQPALPGVPPSVKESGGLEISKEGVMLVGTEAAGKAVGLLAYDITVNPPVLLAQYSLPAGSVEDVEGIVWPDPCSPPVGPSPTSHITSTPVPPSLTPEPSTTPTSGNNFFCPI